ncbi:hypothetical protein V6N11_018704 [Hibiscus sabdariffa]|uniref:Uncharacterized protein n=1 Tax=Hibiscus sabdariffa TaxID=183260 RepID=A0ABR2QSW3_9ROSI
MLKMLECWGLRARKKGPNGWDDVHVHANAFPEGSLANVHIHEEAWPFGGEVDEHVARILLRNVDEPENFFSEYIGLSIRPWNYRKEDAPPCGVSFDVENSFAEISTNIVEATRESVNLPSCNLDTSLEVHNSSCLVATDANRTLPSASLTIVLHAFSGSLGTTVMDFIIVHCSAKNVPHVIAVTQTTTPLVVMTTPLMLPPHVASPNVGCESSTPWNAFNPWRGLSETEWWFHLEYASRRLFEWYSSSVGTSKPCTSIRRTVEGGWGLIKELGYVQFNMERNAKVLLKENARLCAEVEKCTAHSEELRKKNEAYIWGAGKGVEQETSRRNFEKRS